MGVGWGSCWADRLGKYLWRFFCCLNVIHFQFSSSHTVQKISILWTYYGTTFCIHFIMYTVLIVKQRNNNNHITHTLFSSIGCTLCFIKLHSLCINITSKNIHTVLLILPYGIHFFFFSNFQVPLSPLLTPCCPDGLLIKHPQFLDVLNTLNVQPHNIFLLMVWHCSLCSWAPDCRNCI